MGKQKIFYVVNSDWFFLSHRQSLALEALQKGYEVFLLSKDTGRRQEIESLGIKFIDVEFERSGKNPFKDLLLIRRLYRIYREYEPSIIHHVTMKPSLYGTIAANMLGYNPVVINAVTGLGYVFTDKRRSLTKSIIHFLMNLAYKKSKAKFIFQNPDDRGLYERMGFLKAGNNRIIKGAGVDTLVYHYTEPVPKDKVCIIFPARMLWDKGLMEFVEASHLLKDKYFGKVLFVLIGGIDKQNPAAIAEDELRKLLVEGYIEWKGHVVNMMTEYQYADIVCLPSYREGLPKSLVEAMAIGRAIVTTDTVGCRECVSDGENGYIVPMKDAGRLASAMESLIENSALRVKMGKRSREMMEMEMSLKTVINETFDFYGS